MTSLDDLTRMDRPALRAAMRVGRPLDRAAIAGNQYLGVALQLPPPLPTLLWRTFRKTFVQDGDRLRGWNVRMEQTGVDGPARPLRARDGAPITFGHYVVREDDQLPLTAGWAGRDVLDYGTAGNRALDPGRFGYCPLVAVSDDGASLLLGWEVFRVAGILLPLPTWYALRVQGPVEHVVAPPVAV
jgi:hypothetical protein